jgi:aryl-alcohol dehydrogenase-like predicted oxidoreductase
MEHRTLGRSGLSVPVIGMGTWKTFDVRGTRDERRCAEVVSRAAQHGTTLFDTSPMYGEAQRVLSAAVAPIRDRVMIADKVWTPSAREGQEQIARALAWYGTVDIYQVHNLVAWKEQLPALEALKEQDKVRVVGATHYQHGAFGDLTKLMESGRIDMVQIPYSVSDRVVEREVLPLAEQLGIGVLVMQPLGTGKLIGREPSAESRKPLSRFGVRTWAQALLKWIVSDPRVHCVLPATGNADHAQENAKAGDPPWFDEEARDLVASLARAS